MAKGHPQVWWAPISFAVAGRWTKLPQGYVCMHMYIFTIIYTYVCVCQLSLLYFTLWKPRSLPVLIKIPLMVNYHCFNEVTFFDTSRKKPILLKVC